MDERLSKINKLIKDVDIKNNDNELIYTIKKQFPEIETFTFRPSNKVTEGSIIRYVNLNLTNLSMSCIVKKITYRTNLDFFKKKIVKNIYLSHNDNFWRIRATKYYIFESNGKVSSISKILKNDLENYIEGNNEGNDDYLLDQIQKYLKTI